MIFAFVTGRKPLFIFYWTQFPSLSINVDVPAAQERAANVNPQSSFMTPFLGAEATNCQCGEPHSMPKYIHFGKNNLSPYVCILI